MIIKNYNQSKGNQLKLVIYAKISICIWVQISFMGKIIIYVIIRYGRLIKSSDEIIIENY